MPGPDELTHLGHLAREAGLDAETLVRLAHPPRPPKGVTWPADQPTGEGPTNHRSAVASRSFLRGAPSEDRYEPVGVLGKGGMAEVQRVFDRRLGRVVAMKLLRPELAQDVDLCARFVREAELTAQLQHPGIPPVHDIGRLEDGRPFFTLKEVRGQTLIEAVRAYRAAGGLRGEDGPTRLHRLVEAWRAICEALAYAHARGVVHRDLKPTNIMLGDHGEVLVMDWGIARVSGVVDPSRAEWDEVPASSGEHTMVGTVLGTRGFMAPEQEAGRVDQIGPATDTWAAGLLLRGILWPPPEPEAPPDGRESLWRLVAACSEPDPAQRPADASALVDEVRTWLDGSRRRAEARELVVQAAAMGPTIRDTRARAEAERAAAAAATQGVPSHAGVDAKRPAWEHEDEALRLERQAAALAARREQVLQAALTHDPQSPEAHLALATLYQQAHAAAEGARQDEAAARAEARLRAHVVALPLHHPGRSELVTWLKGQATIDLRLPPGVAATLERFVLRDRRLVPAPLRPLAPGPQVLPHGSYLVRLALPGGAEAAYPVHLERLRRWTGGPEGDPEAPLALPASEDLGADDVVVPGGPFRCGDDPLASSSLPPSRPRLPGFVMRRYPVTNRDYLVFLDDLVATGREPEALEHVPRHPPGADGSPGALAYGRQETGAFELVPDADGDLWRPGWPVVFISQASAWAFARWEAARTGLPWRLPTELEWEKAARGVDGRSYPWGEHFDPTWACVRDSHAGVPNPPLVTDFPGDESVYGLRSMVGGMREWTADEHAKTRAPAPPPTGPLPPDAWVTCRGAYWLAGPRQARCASRVPHLARSRYAGISFRLARSY